MNKILQQRIESVQAGKNITHAQIEAKRSLREQLERDVENFLAGGGETQVLPIGFTHFKDGVIPQSKAQVISGKERLDREKAIELKNQAIRGREKFGSDGMCLYFNAAPVIAIFSSGQSPSRKLFTLIHEIVHLGLGESVFDGHLLESNSKLEKYCDRVAGYVVAPPQIVNESFNKALNLEDNILLIRKKTKASKAAIAIQLKILGLINQNQLNEYLDYIKPKEGGGFGSKKENMVLKYFGHSFVEKVMSAMWQDQISSNIAKDILGFHKKSKPSAFKELQQKVF